MQVELMSTLPGLLLAAAAVVSATAAGSARRVRTVEVGAWTAQEHGDRESGRVQLTLLWNTRTWGQGYGLPELRGLSESALQSSASTPVSFRLEREAGSFDFEGSFADGRGSGQFRFRGNRSFASTLHELGISGAERISANELMSLALTGASAEGVRELAGLELGTLTVQKLVDMRIHGVTAEYVRAMREAGVSGIDSPASAVQLRIRGLAPRFVRELEELGYGGLSRSTLTQMRIHGVTPAYVRELQEAGFRDLSAGQLVRMKIHGIGPRLVRGADRSP